METMSWLALRPEAIMRARAVMKAGAMRRIQAKWGAGRADLQVRLWRAYLRLGMADVRGGGRWLA